MTFPPLVVLTENIHPLAGHAEPHQRRRVEITEEAQQIDVVKTTEQSWDGGKSGK
jgi:hypothetical protein